MIRGQSHVTVAQQPARGQCDNLMENTVIIKENEMYLRSFIIININSPVFSPL